MTSGLRAVQAEEDRSRASEREEGGTKGAEEQLRRGQIRAPVRDRRPPGRPRREDGAVGAEEADDAPGNRAPAPQHVSSPNKAKKEKSKIGKFLIKFLIQRVLNCAFG